MTDIVSLFNYLGYIPTDISVAAPDLFAWDVAVVLSGDSGSEGDIHHIQLGFCPGSPLLPPVGPQRELEPGDKLTEG